MEVHGVLFADGRSDATLGVPGVAVLDAPLGNDQDGAVLPREQGGIKPADATAYDDIIVTIH